jgi:hypothetical protein
VVRAAFRRDLIRRAASISALTSIVPPNATRNPGPWPVLEGFTAEAADEERVQRPDHGRNRGGDDEPAAVVADEPAGQRDRRPAAKAMIAVSLGSTGKIASSAGMMIAMAYDSRESTWRLVNTLDDAPVHLLLASAFPSTAWAPGGSAPMAGIPGDRASGSSTRDLRRGR